MSSVNTIQKDDASKPPKIYFLPDGFTEKQITLFTDSVAKKSFIKVVSDLG